MDTISEGLGSFLRRERERKGVTLKTISEQTKVSVPLLEGLEADDLTRWPGGIFRRAFVRGYAGCIGLDPDDVVRRLEQQYRSAEDELNELAAAKGSAPAEAAPEPQRTPVRRRTSSRRVRALAAAADLTVAAVLGLGSAAAGSRMLWPVLLIAAYYALGTLLTGTTPMVALLGDDVQQDAPAPAPILEAVPRPASRKARHENAAREARHESSSRRRHGRAVASSRAH